MVCVFCYLRTNRRSTKRNRFSHATVLFLMLNLPGVFQQGLAQLVQTAGQFIQPLFHAQQQIPAQHHGEPKVAHGAENLFGIHKP